LVLFERDMLQTVERRLRSTTAAIDASSRKVSELERQVRELQSRLP
jgi:polyhydroxyalkanoate synthesis regulator phasin